MNLNIMTVKTKVSTSTDLSAAISAGCVSLSYFIIIIMRSVCVPGGMSNEVFLCRNLLKSDTLLSCLYTNDHGRETPNPANRYQFDKVG